jgi:hypothetical protein
MAADTLGKDAQWWADQTAQLKQENDVLNPQVDALKAKLALAEQGLVIANSRIATADVERQQLEQCRSDLADSHADAQRSAVRITQLESVNKQHRDNLSACFAAISTLYKAIGDSLAVQD